MRIGVAAGKSKATDGVDGVAKGVSVLEDLVFAVVDDPNAVASLACRPFRRRQKRRTNSLLFKSLERASGSESSGLVAPRLAKARPHAIDHKELGGLSEADRNREFLLAWTAGGLNRAEGIARRHLRVRPRCPSQQSESVSGNGLFDRILAVQQLSGVAIPLRSHPGGNRPRLTISFRKVGQVEAHQPGVDQTFEYEDDGSPLAGDTWSLDGGNTNPKRAGTTASRTPKNE